MSYSPVHMMWLVQLGLVTSISRASFGLRPSFNLRKRHARIAPNLSRVAY